MGGPATNVPVAGGQPGGGRSLLPPGDLRSLPGHLAKLVLLAGVVAIAVYALPQLYSKKLWGGFAAVIAATLLILWAYMSKKRIHLKYLVPGTLLLIAFQVYPVIYLLQTSFTNYGDGHLVTRQDAVATITRDSVQQVPNAPTYSLGVATKGSPADPKAAFVFFLTAPNGKVYLGTPKGLAPVPSHGLVLSPIGAVTGAPGYNFLNPIEVNNLGNRLQDFYVPLGHGEFIHSEGISSAYVGRPTLVYNPRANSFRDSQTGVTYKAQSGTYVATNGSDQILSIGYHVGVGFSNYSSVFTNSAIRGPFLKILAWTFAFAVLSVAGCFGIGLFLAIVLNHPRLRGKAIYRSVLLFPYAVPAFISILVWASMFNAQFGLINSLLHVHINWLGSPWWAKAAILITNLWLGFPYMFLVSMGILQSVPSDLLEAARVDGANARRAFRYVTFPLLLLTIEPLLISSFAFNFNNFNIIYLLTGGAPFDYGSVTAGSTDLLISYSYRLSFGSQGAEYGFGGALAILLFILVAAISMVAFRRTNALKAVT